MEMKSGRPSVVVFTVVSMGWAVGLQSTGGLAFSEFLTDQDGGEVDDDDEEYQK